MSTFRFLQFGWMKVRTWASNQPQIKVFKTRYFGGYRRSKHKRKWKLISDSLAPVIDCSIFQILRLSDARVRNPICRFSSFSQLIQLVPCLGFKPPRTTTFESKWCLSTFEHGPRTKSSTMNSCKSAIIWNLFVSILNLRISLF